MNTMNTLPNQRNIVFPYYKKIEEPNTTLKFDSLFESGNLAAAL